VSREHEHVFVEVDRQVETEVDGRVRVREQCTERVGRGVCGAVEVRYIEPPLGADGLCRRHTRASDVMGEQCPTCGHSALLHPGFLDAKDTLQACQVCELAQLIETVKGTL
jgi:hypothetical protein